MEKLIRKLLHDTHKRIYFYFHLRPPSPSNIPSQIHNVSVLSFIKTERYLFEFYFAAFHRSVSPSISINIEWLEKWWKFSPHTLLAPRQRHTKFSRLISMEMIKILLISSHLVEQQKKSEAEGIIRINDGENWQFSFVHDENELRFDFPVTVTLTYHSVFELQLHFQVIKVQWEISHANWIAFNLNFEWLQKSERMRKQFKGDDDFYIVIAHSQAEIVSAWEAELVCKSGRKLLGHNGSLKRRLDWNKMNGCHILSTKHR